MIPRPESETQVTDHRPETRTQPYPHSTTYRLPHNLPYVRYRIRQEIMTRESGDDNGSGSSNWKDALPPGVDTYVNLIDKNWDNFTLDVTNTTTEQVNGFLLHHILYYRSRFYTDYTLWEYFREDFEDWTQIHGNLAIPRLFGNSVTSSVGMESTLSRTELQLQVIFRLLLPIQKNQFGHEKRSKSK